MYAGSISERMTLTIRAGSAPVTSVALCTPAALVANRAYLEVRGKRR